MSVQTLSLRCELHTSVISDKKYAVYLLLQIVHGAGYIWLAVSERPRSLCEIAVFCNIIKYLVVLKIYIHI
jgi:hypothetical protein